jgi:c-di-GMP-binding flagellar brake protein YcgR
MADTLSLDDFRLTAALEIDALLERLRDQRALVTLSTPHGQHCATLLRAVDRDRGIIVLDAPLDRLSLSQAQSDGEVVAVAYLDSIKLQFDIDSPLLVQDGDDAVLHARLPRVMYRFQRRAAFRVRPFVTQSPSASFQHPARPDERVSLRILDISLTGVGLLLPPSIPPIDAGSRIDHCRLTLDDATELDVPLLVHHLTPLNPADHGVRLGCAFGNLGTAERSLQNYINQTQKRQLALAPGRA